MLWVSSSLLAEVPSCKYQICSSDKMTLEKSANKSLPLIIKTYFVVSDDVVYTSGCQYVKDQVKIANMEKKFKNLLNLINRGYGFKKKICKSEKYLLLVLFPNLPGCDHLLKGEK